MSAPTRVVKHMVSPDVEALAAFTACFSARDLAKGGYFMRAGGTATDLGFVNRGLLRFFYVTPTMPPSSRRWCSGCTGCCPAWPAG
ncbi:hypothetical protein [Cupriavidus basilensis]|uniref:hypothetical protein n=1 Tax=Cupriavidus basilensis TaxID=68895 RepID=UPI0023E89A4B|nr:hypothetical protein [Cupriavidus basilensis]MDF3882899.1 hypothetical protein [Cupriavidus basilensis]